MSEQEITTSASTASSAETKPARRGLWIVGLVIGLAIALGAAYFLGFLPGTSKTPEGGVSVDAGSTVATVNAAAITRGELDKMIAEQRSTFPEGAVDPTEDAAFEMAILDNIINIKLLVAEADAQGIQVSDDEVNAEIARVTQVVGGEERLAAELSARGTTKEELFGNTRNEMRIRRVIDANTTIKDITVSDEEIKAMYDEAVQLSPEGQDIPPLEEVKEAARAQLIQQKSGEIVEAYLQTLRAKAAIEVLL